MAYNGLDRKQNKVPRLKAPFIQIKQVVKRSRAYHGLSVYARAALIELIDQRNNGRIVLGVRELAYELRCSADTASRALNDLDDFKLAHPTKVGAWRGKQATEWRLTFIAAPDALPVTSWTPRPTFREFGRKDAKVRQEEHRENLSPATGTGGGKSNEWVKSSSATGTHLDIYHGDNARDEHERH